MVNVKNFKFNEMNLRVTYVDDHARTIEHVVDNKTISSAEIKPISDETRKRLDTERETGFCLNPSQQLLRVFELLTA